MPLKGAGDGSNKAQKQVVNKKGKKGKVRVCCTARVRWHMRLTFGDHVAAG